MRHADPDSISSRMAMGARWTETRSMKLNRRHHVGGRLDDVDLKARHSVLRRSLGHRLRGVPKMFEGDEEAAHRAAERQPARGRDREHQKET
jgi:hypothetical protein